MCQAPAGSSLSTFPFGVSWRSQSESLGSEPPGHPLSLALTVVKASSGMTQAHVEGSGSFAGASPIRLRESSVVLCFLDTMGAQLLEGQLDLLEPEAWDCKDGCSPGARLMVSLLVKSVLSEMLTVN